jgi:hypothetical protein
LNNSCCARTRRRWWTNISILWIASGIGSLIAGRGGSCWGNILDISSIIWDLTVAILSLWRSWWCWRWRWWWWWWWWWWWCRWWSDICAILRTICIWSWLSRRRGWNSRLNYGLIYFLGIKNSIWIYGWVLFNNEFENIHWVDIWSISNWNSIFRH